MIDGQATSHLGTTRATKKIRQFYETDAKGIYDEDLIDDVGYGLLARCESFIIANRTRSGEVLCPQCNELIQREEIMHCTS
ncbi:MAG: hypothetical protein QGG64_07130 [Candidatus Latescibacteria bacterium]|jgi:hypothetical protein|nr:hypothetical protein [Candidatus Latescibacterota bacterium]